MKNENVPILSDEYKNNFLFGKFIMGLKGTPYNTELLMINNISEKSLDIMYNVDNSNKVLKLPYSSIKNFKFKPEMRIQKKVQEVKSNETKSKLLSAASYGGSPLLQLIGNDVFNVMLDTLSNNYEKMDLNYYYEIDLEVSMNNQDIKFMLESDHNPETLINSIKK